MIPGDQVRFCSVTGDTAVVISFSGDDNGIGSATITCDAGKGDEVLKELGRMLTTTTGVIIVGDDINNVFMPNVTAVSAVAISA